MNHLQLQRTWKWSSDFHLHLVPLFYFYLYFGTCIFWTWKPIKLVLSHKNKVSFICKRFFLNAIWRTIKYDFTVSWKLFEEGSSIGIGLNSVRCSVKAVRSALIWMVPLFTFVFRYNFFHLTLYKQLIMFYCVEAQIAKPPPP